MFNKDKLKYFNKFLEDKKIQNLNKTIKLCGFKKHKMKSMYLMNNASGIKTSIDLNNIKEVVLSSEKDLEKHVYDKNFEDYINTYIVYYTSSKEIKQNELSSYIKYIQDNLIRFKKCNIAIFIYNNSIYAITEKIFNGVSTFVESFKWKKSVK